MLSHLTVVLDAVGLDFLLRDDAAGFERRARIDLGELGIALALDLQRPDALGRADALGLDRAVFGDADALALLLGADLGRRDADARIGPFLFDLGELRGAPDLDHTGLIEARIFEVAIDLQRPLLGLVVAQLDVDTRLVLDPVAKPAARLDLLGELGQPLGVEGVRRVEDADVGLVEARQRGVLEFQAVRRQRARREFADGLQEGAAAGVDVVHGLRGGDRGERVGEAALHDRLEFARFAGA